MTYTPNTPLANQTFAATQDPIQKNFAYIQTQQQAEHTFNGNTTAAIGTHLQCSMTAQASPSALPAGTDGMYYVRTSSPPAAGFYDGTNNFTMNLWNAFSSGTFVTAGTSGGTTLVATIPANRFGIMYIWGPLTGQNFTNTICCSSVFFTDSTQLYSANTFVDSTSIAAPVKVLQSNSRDLFVSPSDNLYVNKTCRFIYFLRV